MGKKRRMTRENAKKIVSKTGAGAKKAGAGAVKIAGAPGRKVKVKMGSLNDRMVAVKWTPKKMINEYSNKMRVLKIIKDKYDSTGYTK